MFRFEDPIYLYLLLLIPVLAAIRFLMVYQQKKRLRKFGDPELVRQLMPDVSRFRPLVKFCLLLTALALLIVMVARPQFGTKISHEKRTGIETIICMDISNSMLAEDVAPSRLDRAKMMVENLVDNFTNDKIGLIVFAGDAFVQLPITSDYVSAKMFLSTIDPSMMATQGTLLLSVWHRIASPSRKASVRPLLSLPTAKIMRVGRWRLPKKHRIWVCVFMSWALVLLMELLFLWAMATT